MPNGAVVANRVREQRRAARDRAEEARKKKLAEIFEKFDKDRTGKLSREEVKSMLMEAYRCVPTDEELSFVMRMSDTRQPEGSLGRDEFVDALNCWACYMKEFSGSDSFGNVVFAKYDTDETGKLSKPQLRDLLVELNGGQPVCDEDLDWVLTQADILGDGQVNKIELSQAVAAWFQKKAQSDLQRQSDPPRSVACVLL